MLILVLICVACAVYWMWCLESSKATEPPRCPGGRPIVGHIPYFIGDSCQLWKCINYLAKQIHNIGGVASTKFGPKTVYFVTDPDDIFTIATTCLEKVLIYDFFKPWLGEGLFTSKFSVWKNHRKFLNPAFSQALLDSFMGVFNSQARKLVKNLERNIGNGFFDHSTHTQNNALETICMTTLGVDFRDANLNSKYVEATELSLCLIEERITKVWWYSPITYAWSFIKKKQDACLKILHNVSQTVLERKKMDLGDKSSGNGQCSGSCITTGTKSKIFLDLLLEMSKKGMLNDREIREHVDTIIFGGHDTSAKVIMYTMIMLGSHPEAQEKAFAEVQEIIGDKDRDVEKADLSKLVYLEAILKETMRLFTLAPVIGRQLDRDVKLKNCTLSAGHMCFLMIYAVHKQPMWGPDRHEFKPERWLEPGGVPDNPNAYVPFSVGRRQCIGKAYAFTSMKITLVHLLRRFRITTEHTKLILKYEIMLKPASGHHISLERRK